MPDTYILDADGNPQPEPDLVKWGRWFNELQARIAWTEIGDAHISTIFLGLDHSFSGDIPLLFETMIFWDGHALDEDQARYATREEALAGHETMVARVRSAS